MIDMNADSSAILAHLVEWAGQQPLVRAVLLTSTRAIPGSTPDRLSDFDIVLALEDIHPFHDSRGWLEAFGSVLALYHDPLTVEDGFEQSGYVVQFDDGLKIDFTLLPAGRMRKIVAAEPLPDEYDAGYRVLLDKDGLTAGMRPPTYQAYIPKPPTESEYRRVIEEFMLGGAYVAKLLWRGDLIAARFLVTNELIDEHLRPMLEWHIETERNWSVKPGPYGRGIQKWLRPDLRAALEDSLVGPGFEENWASLFRLVELMHKVGCEVGERLGYPYPEEMHDRAVTYFERVKEPKREE